MKQSAALLVLAFAVGLPATAENVVRVQTGTTIHNSGQDCVAEIRYLSTPSGKEKGVFAPTLTTEIIPVPCDRLEKAGLISLANGNLSLTEQANAMTAGDFQAAIRRYAKKP